MNFFVAMHSFPLRKYKDQFVLVFDLTSMHDATEKRQDSKKVREPLRLEPNYTFVLAHVFELIVLGDLMSSVDVAKFCVVGENI